MCLQYNNITNKHYYIVNFSTFLTFFSYFFFTLNLSYKKLSISTVTMEICSMLDVIYIENGIANPCNTKREQYLDCCLGKCSVFHLSKEEKWFIKNLLLLITCYMEYVLIEEEYNTLMFARMLTFCNVTKENYSTFLFLVEAALQNDSQSLTEQQVHIMQDYLEKLKPFYFPGNVLLALQVLQFYLMLNPECSKAISNLLNLAILKCNMSGEENKTLSCLCDKAIEEQYLSFVFPEFSSHYENLLKHSKIDSLDNDLLDYTYKKFRCLPKDIVEKIEMFDFEIRLSNELILKQKDQRKLGAVHLNGKHIRVWLEHNKEIIDITFYHEIGHVVDYVFGNCGLHSRHNKAWYIIYEMDKGKFFEYKKKENPNLIEIYEYGISNQTEYFASAFSEYIQEPEGLEKNVPDTFYYLETLLNQ